MRLLLVVLACFGLMISGCDGGGNSGNNGTGQDGGDGLGNNPCNLSTWLEKALNGCKQLSGAKLSDTNLSHVDLLGAVLSNADLSYADLAYADLSYAKLGGADLTGADMLALKVTGADFIDTIMEDANLNGVGWQNTRCPDGTNSDNNGKTCCDHLMGVVPSAGCD